MARGAAVIRFGARGAPVIRVGAVLDLGVSGGRGLEERLVMEATPLQRWWMVGWRVLLPAGAGEGEPVAVVGKVVGEAETQDGDGKEMA